MNSPVAHTKSLVKEKLMRALVGGFVGTAIFTMMGKFFAPHVIGQPMDVAALMAPMLGGSHTVGIMAHFVIGTVIFPIAYLILGFSKFRDRPGYGEPAQGHGGLDGPYRVWFGHGCYYRQT